MPNKQFLLFFIFATIQLLSFAQKDSTEKYLIQLNDAIDQAIVKKDSAFLYVSYAEDLKFTHNTGMMDTKKSWLKNVLNPKSKYFVRRNTKVKVDVFGNMALVSGILTSVTPYKTYVLPYGRMYRKNNQNNWEMFLHTSITNLE